MSENNYFVVRQKLSHLNNIFPTVLSQSPRAFLPKNEIFHDKEVVSEEFLNYYTSIILDV